MAERVKQALKAHLFPQSTSFAPQLGRFTILREVGRGGMGVVYVAYDETLDRRVALKLLYEPSGDDNADQSRLLREAQAMARLNHPNIATVYEAGTHEGRVFIAMEFVHGKPLDVWLQEHQRPWDEIVGVFVQAGRGLHAAHCAGLVHRDFKPANVMLGTDGRVRVLDFGLARGPRMHLPDITIDDDPAIGATTPQSASLGSGGTTTGEGVIAGTPAYMPPEQFRGESLDHRADQYALCVSLFEAIYRKLPFRGDTIADLWSAVLAGPPKTPPRSPRVPSWLYRILVRGLSPNPAYRFPSMTALLDALERRQGRRLRNWLLGTLGASVLAGSVYGYEQYRHRQCAFGEAELAGVWDADLKAELRNKFTGGQTPAAAGKAWAATEALLDEHADDWLKVQHQACEDHASGKESARLYDRRNQCIRRSKYALTAAVNGLVGADTIDSGRTASIAHMLSETADCAFDKIEQWDVDPPPPSKQPIVDQLWQDFYRLQQEASDSNKPAVLEATHALLEKVREVDYSPLAVYVLLMKSNIEQQLGLHREACASLQDSFFLAEEAGNNVQAAHNASGLLAICVDTDSGQEAVASTWARIALAKLKHAEEQGTLTHAIILARLASAMMELKRSDAAAAYLVEGLEILRSDPTLSGDEDADAAATFMLLTSSRYLGTASDSTMKRTVHDAQQATTERLYGAKGGSRAILKDAQRDYFEHAEGGRWQDTVVSAEQAWGVIRQEPNRDPQLLAEAASFLAAAYVGAERCMDAMEPADEAWDVLRTAHDLDVPTRRSSLFSVTLTYANCGNLGASKDALEALYTLERGMTTSADGIFDQALAAYEMEAHGDMRAVGAMERVLAQYDHPLYKIAIGKPMQMGLKGLYARALWKAGKTEKAKLAAEQSIELGTDLWGESNLALCHRKARHAVHQAQYFFALAAKILANRHR